MQFGVAMLVCLFILCAARTIDAGLRRIGLSTGGMASFSLLMLAMCAVRITPVPEIALNAAVVLLPLFSLLWALRGKERRCVSRAAGAAVPAAMLMLLIRQIAPDIPAALTGLCAVICMPLLRGAPRGGFFMAALAPLLLCAGEAAIDLTRYGYAMLDFAAPAIQDAQVAAMCAVGVYMALYACKKDGGHAAPPDSGDCTKAAAP